MEVKNKTSVNISIDTELFEQIEVICAKLGRSQSWFFKHATKKFIAECLEDIADYEAGVAAWEEFEKSGRQSCSAEEVFEKAGL